MAESVQWTIDDKIDVHNVGTGALCNTLVGDVMATQPYIARMTKDTTVFPIVLYARSIGKNTAEFTGKDLRKFLKWLWQVEPYKRKLWEPTATTYFSSARHGKGKRAK